MKLQNILFPCIETTAEETLYFRRDRKETAYTLSENKIIFDKRAKISFDTYYNSFSLGKWTKYTNLENLSLLLDLEGEFSLCISVCSYFNGKILKDDILCRHINNDKRDSINVSIPNLNYKGSIVFTLTACKDNSIFYGGYYGTAINEKDVNSVRIAIGICTFRREKYVIHNLKLLSKEFIENEKSSLFGLLEVYVSDNGMTLDYDALNTDFIHVFPNKNLGGSGGFTRCMYEMYKDRENKKYSHILLADDDVIIAPESIYRTYTFLCMLKQDYKEAFIGGAMLRLDVRYMQSEAADYTSRMGNKPVKGRYDLRHLEFVLKNEIEEPVNYFSWWYCVMPAAIVTENNLPFPMFINRDDIDYSLRNGKIFITLNGILVWHEPFENRRSGSWEYYYFRNICILNAIHYPQYGKREIKKQLLQKCVKYCLQYRYKDALLCIHGVEDFLKGIDYFKTIDAEKLHRQIMKETYESRNVKDVDFQFAYGIYINKRGAAKESKLDKLLRYITFNGYLLPAKKTTALLSVSNPPTNRLYRVKRAIYFYEASDKAFEVTRSWPEGLKILRAYLKCCRLISSSYDAVKKEYQNRYKELINIEFWERYLFSDSNMLNKK